MLQIATGNRTHPESVRGKDLYETPTQAVDVLLALEKIPKCVWECACGPGAIAHVLRERGHKVTATDLIDYGCPDSEADRDFMLEQRLPKGVKAILTNPPYKLANEFFIHATHLCPKVYMLMRLAFLETETRLELWRQEHLRRVIVFNRRLPMMHRADWTGPKASSAMAFAWFCWDRDYVGKAELSFVDWKDYERPTTYQVTHHFFDEDVQVDAFNLMCGD